MSVGGRPDVGHHEPATRTGGHGTVTITAGRQQATVAQRPDQTLLQAARFGGLHVLASCEQGHCGTCMARVTQGAAEMLSNELLDDDEVAEGWVLTCQAVPVTPDVHVVYDF